MSKESNARSHRQIKPRVVQTNDIERAESGKKLLVTFRGLFEVGAALS